VWLPPNPGLTPAIQTLNQINPGVTQLAIGLTQMFNGAVLCQQPDEYLFWDGIHPTKAAHAIVAVAASLLIGQ
jgi:phospholipase/lecithinase/hemolysin